MARRRESFNEVAALYDRARPPYPPEVLQDVVGLSGLGAGDRVLEVGSGTGQMTAPLAQRGFRVTALEPGDALAAITRRKLAEHPAVEVVEQTFEAYRLPKEPFDLVISATAFHWVDPAIRVVKAAQALRPGGWLAIVDTHWGVGGERDAFGVRSQACWERWEPESRPGFLPPKAAELPATRPELEESAAFATLARRLYPQLTRYTTASYLDLLRTFSNVRGLEVWQRSGLVACLGRLIDDDFGGRLTRSDTRELWLARRCPP